jgi:hypothetical protein
MPLNLIVEDNKALWCNLRYLNLAFHWLMFHVVGCHIRHMLLSLLCVQTTCKCIRLYTLFLINNYIQSKNCIVFTWSPMGSKIKFNAVAIKGRGFGSHRGRANFSACPVWIYTRSITVNIKTLYSPEYVTWKHTQKYALKKLGPFTKYQCKYLKVK